MWEAAEAASAAACASASWAVISPIRVAASAFACSAALIWASLGLPGAAAAAPGIPTRPTTATAPAPITRRAQRPLLRRPTSVPTCSRTELLLRCPVHHEGGPGLDQSRHTRRGVLSTWSSTGSGYGPSAAGASPPKGGHPRSARVQPGPVAGARGEPASRGGRRDPLLAVGRRPELLTELELLDLAGGGPRDRLPELHPLGRLVVGQPGAAVRDDLRVGGRGALGEHHESGDHLAPLVVGHPDHRDLGHRG